MDDLGVQYTDKKVEALEKKLAKAYKQASKEIGEKLKDFTEKSAAKESKYLQMVKDGTMTQDAFDKWKQGQVFYGDAWKSQQQNMAKVLADTNKTATDWINGEKADVFAFNGNYTAYDMEHGFGVNFGFDLYSEDSVKHLLKDNPKILPKSSLSISKDEKWNMRNIRSQITQGILQGESIPKIADRLANLIPERNRNQMVLHARTAMTSAQNAGRQERYKEAEALGIKFKKVWLATLDARTRETHQDADGQAVRPDEDFVVGGEKLAYPGDPSADPAETYNCRCTMVTELDDYPSSFDRRAYDTDDSGHRESYITKDTTYKEWLKGKQSGAIPVNIAEPTVPTVVPSKPLQELSKLKATMDDSDYQAYHDMVDQNDTIKPLYENYAEGVNVSRSRNGGSYRQATNSIDYSYDKGDQNKYSTLAHEYGHAFDAALGKEDIGVHYNELGVLNDHCKFGSGTHKIFKELPSSSDEYLDAIRKDKEIIRQAIKDPDVRAAFKADSASAGIQDLADGLFGTQDSKDYFLPWGHGNAYYNRAYNRKIKDFGLEKDLKQAFTELGFDASNQSKCKNLTRIYETSSELWANQSSALTVGGKELEYMEKYAPNSLQVLKGIAKGVGK